MMIDCQTYRDLADHGGNWNRFMRDVECTIRRALAAAQPLLTCLAALAATALALGASVMPGVAPGVPLA